MSLPKTEWRYLGASTLNGASTGAILESISTLGQASTYSDGSARTIGSGSAATYTLISTGTTRVLHIDTAVRTVSNKIVLCADTVGLSTNNVSLPNGASRLPTIASGEGGFFANKSGAFWQASSGEPSSGSLAIFSTIIKNPGSYSHWTAVNPFTSGSFFGYYKSLVTTTSGFTGQVYVWESKDCIAIALVGSQNYFIIAGAILDPESPDTTLDSESDGKIYGIITNSFSSNWLESVALSGPTNAVASVNQLSTVRSVVFEPASSAPIRIFPVIWYNDLNASRGVWSNYTSFLSPLSLFTRSGRLVRIPIVFRAFSTSHTLGRLRDIYLFRNSRVPQRLMNGNVPLGYAFGPSNSADVNCLFLEH